jgi:hypothetical protein
LQVEVPTLSPDTLSAELQHIHRKRHRVQHTLLLARMQPFLDALSVRLDDTPVTFHVAQARCELELRAALPDRLDAPPTVVLLDWDPGRLPADLLGRVATGAVQTIARARRIRGAFSGAPVTTELLEARELVDAIVNEPGFRRPVPPGGLVTLDLAWRSWLVARKVFPQENEREMTFVAHVATSPPPPLRALLEARPALRQRLDAWLAQELGPVAPWALTLWLEGRGVLAAALAFVFEAARASLGQQDYLDGVLSTQLAALCAPLAKAAQAHPRLLHQWADLAGLLAVQLGPELVPVLNAADKVLPEHEALAEALAQSDALRVALVRRKADLAACLEEAVAAPTPAHRRAALSAMAALQKHRLCEHDPAQKALCERARMAVRLLGWLEDRAQDVPFGAVDSDHGVMAERAEDYVRQGAFVDWARRVARGSTSDRLGQAIGRVVEAADAQRDRDDAQFAHSLVRWNELGRTSERVVPIESALERFAAGFLRGHDARRLLVLVLDGLSWDGAVELLESLEGSSFAPLRWRMPGHESVFVAPMVAALPTITEVSRAALFAGRLLGPGDALDSGRDPQRFAQHRALQAFGARPTLMLKGALQTLAGDASKEALDLIARDDRVVAVVVNAVDDSLKAGRQTRAEFSLEAIKPLRDLLERAALARRAVLLVADHGHVSGARMTRLPSAASETPGGTRWRAAVQDGAADAGEVSTTGPYVWRPPGFARLRMLCQETVAYGLGVHAGEHGGVTLAEAVAPAVLVGAASLADRVRAASDTEAPADFDLEVRALPRPAWWRVDDVASLEPVARPAPAAPRPRKEVPAQIPLAGLDVPLRPAPPPRKSAVTAEATTSPWEGFFARSKVLKEMGRKMDPRFVAAIDALASEGGTLSIDRLARSLEMIAPRIEGLVASMSELLNADGTRVIHYDAVKRVVCLDEAALREIFA